MPLRDVSEQVRNKWRRRSEPMLSTVKQNQQHDQQEPSSALSPPSIKPQEQQQQQQQPDTKPAAIPQPKTDKPAKLPTNDLAPNPDTLVFGIGDYQFLSQLGEGKFSKVMLAQHFLTGERFAIKMIDKRMFDDRVMTRLIREVGIMEALHHPNIARLYETYETAYTLYLVMEYIPGVNLDEYLKRMGGNLKEHDARMIFRQVVAAVDYCHRKWVVHRDLKAPNILLTKNNQVHLVDFGLSNRFGHQRLRTICGSMLYYSPEIINGKKYIGPEVDCWCLGICLFRMVAGFEAFSRAKTIGELRKDILNRNYPMPAHFSEGLKRTIQKCLSTDRRKRSSLCNALEGDPWLNDFGKCDDLFSDASNYHAAMYQFAMPSSVSTDTITLEVRQQERDQQQRQYLRDMEEEKRVGYKARKTIIHHAYNTSFYYTGHGCREERSLLEPSRAALYQEILTVLNQISLCPANTVHFSSLRSPMTHLFRKWKRPDIDNGHSPFTSPDSPVSPDLPSSISVASETPPTHHNHNHHPQHHPSITNSRLVKKSSTVSISQLYQRTKDKTCYFSIQSNARTISSTTVLSLTSSSNTVVSLLDDPHYHQQPSSDNTAQDEYELVLLVRSVCELLGVTYLHESKTQLSCVLTLCDYREDDRQQSPTKSIAANQHKSIPRKTSIRHLFSTAGSVSGGAPTSLMKKRKSFTNNSLHPQNILLPLDSSCNNNNNSNSKQQDKDGASHDVIGTKEDSNEWWIRQQQRLSLPHTTTTSVSKQQQQQQTLRHASSVQVIRSSTTPRIFGLRGKASFDNFFQRKQADAVKFSGGEVDLDDHQQQQQQQQQSATGSVTDGTAVFSIEVFFVPSKQKENDHTRLLGIRFTKMSGSAKVYKLATGWITNVLQSKTQLV